MSDQKIYKLIVLFIFLLGQLPKSILLFFSDSLALIWYMLDKRHRNLVIQNIQKAYPGEFSDKQAKNFALKNFRHTASILFEVIWSRSLEPEKLFEYFTIEGLEYLEKAMAQNRGVIVVTCHMGVFEFLPLAIAQTGIKPYALYRKMDFEPLERMMLEGRQRFGSIMIPLRGASKTINNILKGNNIVATLLDQNVDWYKGVFVDFFGRPACTNNGLAKLVIKLDPVVIPAFMMKKEKFILKFLSEIPTEITGDTIKDIENNTQAYVSAVEKMVRQSPGEYFWVHNRWKTKPYSLLNQDS